MSQRNLPMTKALKEQLSEFASRETVAMGAIIRNVERDYADGVLNVPLAISGRVETNVKYNSSEAYDRALARSEAEGISLADALRYGVEQRTK